MIPKREPKARLAKSVFFRSFNDIDVYIEDTAIGFKKIYRTLLNRVFDGHYFINDVFPIGTKNLVVSACAKDAAMTGRPRVYIVDGDFDILNGTIPSLPRLFCLPVYCIENILIDGDAILEILNEDDPEKHLELLIAAFDFDAWVDGNHMHGVELFIEYAIAFRIGVPDSLVSYKVSNLVSSGSGYLCPVKTANRIAAIRHSAISHGGIINYGAYRSIVTTYLWGQCPKLAFLNYVSGKDALLPLIKLLMRSTSKISISDIELMLRLSQKCAIERLEDVFKHILPPI